MSPIKIITPSTEVGGFSCDSNGCSIAPQSSTTDPEQVSRPKIYYVHDLLCSFCYGFIPVMEKFIHEYQNQYDIQFVSCGLFIGDKIKPVHDFFSENYKDGYDKVIKMTGAPIHANYFDDLVAKQNYVVNSVKTASALEVYRNEISKEPSKLIHFQKVFQDMIYQEATAPNEEIFYEKLATKLELPTDFFTSKMSSESISELVNKDFEKTRKVFHNKLLPSLYLESEPNVYENIISGYHNYDQLVASFDSILKTSQKS